jgi:hypothetical protein
MYMFCCSIGCKVDLDIGDMMTQMINTSIKTLEDELKTYTQIEESPRHKK